MRIILGSQSPRRKEILGYFSIPFEQAVPSYCEELLLFNGNPVDYAQELSKGKSDALFPLFPNATIITADTVVFREGKIYGKPQNASEAFQALSELAGKWHSVFTAVTIRYADICHTDVEETRVQFNAINSEHIRNYQQRIHCEDKAGGYAIQGAGSLIVRKIEGCYYNVMGLPIHTLQRLLLRIGIDLWDYLPA